MIAVLLSTATHLEPRTTPPDLYRDRVPREVPPVYRWLRDQAMTAPVFEMPANALLDDAIHLYMAGYNHRPIVNGTGGYIPQASLFLEERFSRFPESSAVRLMREIGVRYVIQHGVPRDAPGPNGPSQTVVFRDQRTQVFELSTPNTPAAPREEGTFQMLRDEALASSNLAGPDVDHAVDGDLSTAWKTTQHYGDSRGLGTRFPFGRCFVLVLLILSMAELGVMARLDSDELPPGAGSAADASPAPRFRAPKNLLLVVLDATAARRWSLYGYEEETTPFLDSMEEQSTVFDAAYSQSTSTNPSAWSYMTGRYVYWPGGTPDGFHVIRQGKDVPLAAAFQEAGFATGGFSENLFVSGRLGFDTGFDEFEYTDLRFNMERGNYFRDAVATESVVRGAQEWMASRGSKRWFCYIHLVRPHNPYLAPEPFRGRFLKANGSRDAVALNDLNREERRILGKGLSSAAPIVSRSELAFLINLYEGNIAYTDDLVRRLFVYLREAGLLDTTLVIITSDHGEAFFEHGQLLHGRKPYEEMIHVPLVVRAPKTSGFVRGRVTAPVELVDLFPTFRDLFSLNAGQELDGASLLPVLRGEETATGKELSFAEAGSISVRKGSRKLLVRVNKESGSITGYELYDLALDPGEQNDLFVSEEQVSDLIAPAKRYLATRRRGTVFSMPRMTVKERKLLKALGYLQ